MLGHADLATTQRYITDDPELLRSLAENGPVDTKRTHQRIFSPTIPTRTPAPKTTSPRFTFFALHSRSSRRA